MANGKSVCPLITQQVAKIPMSNHIYSESACLGAGFIRPVMNFNLLYFSRERYLTFFSAIFFLIKKLYTPLT